MDVLVMILLPVILLVSAVMVGTQAPWAGVLIVGIGLVVVMTMRSLRTRKHAGDTKYTRERRIRSLPGGDDPLPEGEPPPELHRKHKIV
jgi:hypothetical protein